MIGDIKKRTGRALQVKLTDEIPVTPALVEYCLSEFYGASSRFKVLDDYFHGDNIIKSRTTADPLKPNNHIPHNFSRYISRIATAYFLGGGVRYAVPDPQYKAELDGIFEDNQNAVKLFEEAIIMSKLGVSYELLYINESGKLKTQVFSGDELLPVFGQGVGRFLVLALRPYEETELLSKRVTSYCDVYTAREIIRFQKLAGKHWQEIERFSHNFSDVPVIVRKNNSDAMSDFEDVIPQIDGYDRAQSDTANDLDYFTNAYMALEGVTSIQAEDEEGNELSPQESARAMKEERLLYFPQGAKGYFITKPAGDNTAESHKDRLYKDIFFLSQVPNLTDESFAGNVSGVAQRFKLFGLEELTSEKEQYFISSEHKKLRLITEHINTLKSTAYDWRTVELTFDRAAITNTLEIAQVVNYMRDILSEETLIAQFPGVDVKEELERKAKELAVRENLTQPDDLEVF